MAQTIKLKRSATSGAVPTTSSLALGEVAINTHDGKMYIKKDDGTASVVEIGATGSQGTADTAAQILTKIKTVDGTGSGLDADTVDGIQGSSFLRSDAFDTSSSGLYLQGGSYNAGTDTATVSLLIDHGDYIYTKDGGNLRKLIGKSSNAIYIGQGATSLINTIHLNPGTAGNSAVRVNNNTVWNAGNDGSGSGLDADTCDGQHLSTSSSVQFGSVSHRGFTSSSINAKIMGSGDSAAKLYWRKNDTNNLMSLDMSGNLTATGNVTAYSDRRIKENITPITEALSKVQRLTGNTYTRNDQEDTATKYAGLIAQEVEDVLPEAVREADDGIKALDYNATIALLVESIKELKAEVDDLKTQLENK